MKPPVRQQKGRYHLNGMPGTCTRYVMLVGVLHTHLSDTILSAVPLFYNYL